MSWTLTTSGAATTKAGVAANRRIVVSGAALALWSDQAEGVINTETRKDWVAGYTSVTTNFKGILSDVASSMVAINIINYDTSDYSPNEATNRVTILNEGIKKNLLTLTNKDIQLFVTGA